MAAGIHGADETFVGKILQLVDEIAPVLAVAERWGIPVALGESPTL